MERLKLPDEQREGLNVGMNSYCYFIAASWGDTVVSQHFQAMSRELIARGHRVVYLPHGIKVQREEDNFLVNSFPSPRPTRPQDFIFLHNLIRRHRPHCMIANFGATNVMTLVGLLDRVPCRVVWYRTLSSQNTLDSHSSGILNRLKVTRKTLVFRALTHLVGNSDFARQDAHKNYHVPADKSLVFYNSIADPFSDNSIIEFSSEDKPLLICAGRFDRSKGQEILLRAFAMLKDEFPEARVELLGQGHLEAEYRKLAYDLGVTEHVDFRGAVSRTEVLRAMAAGAITIVPSRSEAFGLVNIESMSVGTPVIASRVGGIPEIIRDNMDGFLVQPDSPDALAEKLRIMLSDPNLRERMGKNARQRFLDKFERKKNLDRQVTWLEQIVQRQLQMRT